MLILPRNPVTAYEWEAWPREVTWTWVERRSRCVWPLSLTSSLEWISYITSGHLTFSFCLKNLRWIFLWSGSFNSLITLYTVHRATPFPLIWFWIPTDFVGKQSCLIPLLRWFPYCFRTSHLTLYIIWPRQALCGLPWSNDQSVVSRETARRWKMPALTWHFRLTDTMWKTREPPWAGAPAAWGAFLSAPVMCSLFPPWCAPQSSHRTVMEPLRIGSVVLCTWA